MKRTERMRPRKPGMPRRAADRVRSRARRQEGGVILIVLLVVMMMSGLAAFAAQNGTYEVRSVGGTRQIQRLRRSGESFLVAVGAFLAERFVGGKRMVAIADSRWTDGQRNDGSVGDNRAENFRVRYNLPAYFNDRSLMQVERHEFAGVSFPLGDRTLPTDVQIDPGVVSPFVFDGVTLLERYDMPTQAGQGMGMNAGMLSGMRSYRVCATAYSRMTLNPTHGTDQSRAGELRRTHDSIGISRAYFELR